VSLAPTAPGVTGSIDADVLGAQMAGYPGAAGAPASLSAAAAAPGAAAAPWYAGIPGATTVANFAGAHPLLTAAGIGGATLLGGQKIGSMLNPPLPNQQDLQNVIGAQQAQFQQLGAEGQTLMQGLLTGQLPPGWQTMIDHQLDQVRGKYAQLGLTGSTMEAQDLANTQVTSALNIAQTLANSGQTLISDASNSLTGAGQNITGLMNARVAQDTATQSAIGQFAGALALSSALGSRGTA
jgi:hypothetical protein